EKTGKRILVCLRGPQARRQQLHQLDPRDRRAALEGMGRADETSPFDQRLDPVSRDRARTLTLFHNNGIGPGGKGRNHVCRRLLRRVLDATLGPQPWAQWVEGERRLRDPALDRGRRLWRRHKDRPPHWWWETCGLTEEDLKLLG